MIDIPATDVRYWRTLIDLVGAFLLKHAKHEVFKTPTYTRIKDAVALLLPQGSKRSIMLE